MKKLILILGILALIGLVSGATTTSQNVSVTNVNSTINTIFTFNKTGTYKPAFDYLDNISIKVNITNSNGRNNIGTVNITLTLNNGTVMINNVNMSNITQITNGFTYEYNYTLNRTSYPGNYTINVTTNMTSNTTQFIVGMIVKAIVGSPSSCSGQEIRIYNVSTSSDTFLEGQLTSAEPYCIANFSREFNNYYIVYPLYSRATPSVYKLTNDAYNEVTISGESSGGGGSGGGGSGISSYVSSTSESVEDFIFDLRVMRPYYLDNYIHFEVILKNIVHKSGDIMLNYMLVKNGTGITSHHEQVFVKVTNESDVCSTVDCPHLASIYLEDCSEDIYLKAEAISLKNSNNESTLLAETQIQVCSKKDGMMVAPFAAQPTKQAEGPPLLLIFLGIISVVTVLFIVGEYTEIWDYI